MALLPAAVPAAVLLLLSCAAATASPILGVPAYSFGGEGRGGEGAVSPAAEGLEFAHLVVTTERPVSTPIPEDVVPLDSAKERSRFLVSMLMLEGLHNKPFGKNKSDPKLQKELMADEEVMQEVLKLYESQQETKGQHYIKIPPKLMKKIKRKMKELLSN